MSGKFFFTREKKTGSSLCVCVCVSCYELIKFCIQRKLLFVVENINSLKIKEIKSFEWDWGEPTMLKHCCISSFELARTISKGGIARSGL